MGEEKDLIKEIESGDYDASDRPFDFVESDAETALICEPDENVRAQFNVALTNMGYQTTVAASAREALKGMRFHLFDVVIVNEKFDGGAQDRNDVLAYLETLAMSTRRQIFVALVSENHRTSDNMTAFHRSVNVVINVKHTENLEVILRAAIADNNAFYRVMKESLQKVGKI